MHNFVVVIYTILWFFVILYMVPKIYRPQSIIDERNKLKAMTDIKEAKSRLMMGDGIPYLLSLILAFVGMIWSSSWPIAGALFLLLLIPEVMFWGVWSCLWLSIRSALAFVLIIVLMLNINLVHWTMNIVVSSTSIQLTIPLLSF